MTTNTSSIGIQRRSRSCDGIHKICTILSILVSCSRTALSFSNPDISFLPSLSSCKKHHPRVASPSSILGIPSFPNSSKGFRRSTIFRASESDVTSSSSSSSSTTTTPPPTKKEQTDDDPPQPIQSFLSDVSSSLSILFHYNTFLPSKTNKTTQQWIESILSLCDQLEDKTSSNSLLERKAMEYSRYNLLQSMMESDYDAYVKTANFLSPSRIPREELPNIQDVLYTAYKPQSPNPQTAASNAETILNTATPSSPTLILKDDDLVPDCSLPNATFIENPLDTLLLSIFRNLVQKNSNDIAVSTKPGIPGLLEQGRTYMRSGATPEEQHTMVRTTLGNLMTPIVPIYRLFMSGIIPNFIANRIDPNRTEPLQFGPLFYAPYLTSVVTPPFFSFLVGPSQPNARKDGQAGGLLVTKCKFLQESNCKGLCLHQCKLPAQEFFKEDLGMALSVMPNFETQECQWSFGEVPLPYEEDSSFPKGCLVGCESRQFMNEKSVVISSCG